MKRNYVFNSFTSILMLVSTMAFAQAPANDECSGAISITQASSKSACAPTAVNTVGATKSSAPTISCAPNSSDDDVWYKFVANSANVTASASNKGGGITSTTGIGFTLYSDSCTGPQSAECTAGAGGDTIVFHNLSIGHTYLLRTFTQGTTATGTYDICIYTYTPPPPPANDICSNATVIIARTDTTCSPTVGTLISANQESAADSCAGVWKSPTAFDVWYKFNATATTHVIDVTSPSNGLVAVLYTACNGNAIACANPRTIATFVLPGTSQMVVSNLTIGQPYFVRVYAHSPTAPITGAFQICVRGVPPPPPNDQCATAITLVPESTDTCVNPIPGKFNWANQESAPDSCDGAVKSKTAYDVWYKFVAKADAHDVEVATAAFTDPGMMAVVYDSNNGVCSTAIACANPTVIGGNIVLGGVTRVKAMNLILGHTYFVRVYPYASTLPPNGNFTICLYTDSAATMFVGVNEMNALSHSLNLYPNPAKDQLHVVFNASSSVKIKLLNVNGQVVYTENFDNFNGGAFNKNIDISAIAKGVYMLQIITDKETVLRKVVKE